ncbi:TPA: Clp protease ClpP, partial [Enterococcus faecium]|nr:Clp protease ClpP [Enterococcus faecium]
QKKYWRDDDVINAKDIRDSLDTVTDDIVIKLNSPGGDVFEGIEIYNYLKDHPSNITVEVTGLAASAATFIVAGANDVIMNVGTSLMIHEASTFAWGNKQDIQKTLNALETIDDSILAIYSDKTGQSVDKLREWMNEEKWFTADEAVKYGFANSVKREEPQNEPQNIAAMIQD